MPKGGELHVKNPSNTQEEIGVVYLSEAARALQAGEAARRALPKWAGLTGAQRGDHLYRMAAVWKRRPMKSPNSPAPRWGNPSVRCGAR